VIFCDVRVLCAFCAFCALTLAGGEPPRAKGELTSSCAQAKKTIDLVDSKSASVSAQAERDYNRALAEGERAFCPRGLPARKRKRADKSKSQQINKITKRAVLQQPLFAPGEDSGITDHRDAAASITAVIGTTAVI